MIAKTRFMRLPSVCRVAYLQSLLRLGNAGQRDVTCHGRRRPPRSSPMAALGETQYGVCRGPVIGGMIRGPQRDRNKAQ